MEPHTSYVLIAYQKLKCERIAKLRLSDRTPVGLGDLVARCRSIRSDVDSVQKCSASVATYLNLEIEATVAGIPVFANLFSLVRQTPFESLPVRHKSLEREDSCFCRAVWKFPSGKCGNTFGTNAGMQEKGRRGGDQKRLFHSLVVSCGHWCFAGRTVYLAHMKRPTSVGSLIKRPTLVGLFFGSIVVIRMSVRQGLSTGFDRGVPFAELRDQHRHLLLIAHIVVAEKFHQISLFITNRDQDVSCHADGEQQVSGCHRRGAPEAHYPADIQGMADELIEERHLEA